MGVRAVFKCLDCDRKFKKSVGSGWLFELFRCVKCDSTKEVIVKDSIGGERTMPNDIRCRRCGDEMRDDISPMCTFCRGRSN